MELLTSWFSVFCACVVNVRTCGLIDCGVGEHHGHGERPGLLPAVVYGRPERGHGRVAGRGSPGALCPLHTLAPVEIGNSVHSRRAMTMLTDANGLSACMHRRTREYSRAICTFSALSFIHEPTA